MSTVRTGSRWQTASLSTSKGSQFPTFYLVNTCPLCHACPLHCSSHAVPLPHGLVSSLLETTFALVLFVDVALKMVAVVANVGSAPKVRNKALRARVGKVEEREAHAGL